MGYYDDYYRAVVIKVVRLSPTIIRIAFGDEDLGRFTTSGFGDERLVVVFPITGERHAPAPTRLADGTLDYPDDEPQPELRSYTVRRWDAQTAEMIIDFVAHEGGVAATWVLQTQPGDTVYLSPASGWHQPPPDAQWQILVADLTGLPALGRIVEELPAGARAHCIVEVADVADIQQLTSAGHVTYDWVVAGNGHGPSRLTELVREHPLPLGPGYLWFAGEAAESRSVRKYLRRELRWTQQSFTVLGYWRPAKEAWMERYEQVGESLEKVYEEAVAAGRSSGDALEMYDEALERAGL